MRDGPKSSMADRFNASLALLLIVRGERGFVPSITQKDIRAAVKNLPDYLDFDGCSDADIPEIVELASLIAEAQHRVLRDAVYRNESFTALAAKALGNYQHGPKAARRRKKREPAVSFAPPPVPMKPKLRLVHDRDKD